MIRFFFLFFYFSFSFSQITERYHPELNWEYFETEHFRIVFHEGTKRSAIRVANIAEHIYGPVTKAYDFEPRKRISLIVKDIDDYSNGAAYFLENKIEIWTESLDYDLRGTHDWLKDVVTHEFTHMVHIQKSLVSSKHMAFAMVQWIGYEKERRQDVLRGYPNRIAILPILFFNVPPWLAEGVAQHQNNESRYDYRDSQREMILRDRFVNDNVLGLTEMINFGKSSIGNESVYNQGFSFIEFLIQKFGQKALIDISIKNSSIKSLFSFDKTVFEENFNQSLDALYGEWYQLNKKKYTKALRTIKKNEKSGKIIENKGEGNFYPIFSNDGNYIAYLSNQNNRRLSKNTLVLINRKTGEKTFHTNLISSQIKWLPNQNKLLYSKKHSTNQWGSHYNDLYLYDIESKNEIRITYNCRAKNAVVTENNDIIFVTSYDGSTNLMSFHLGKEKYYQKINYENFEVRVDDIVENKFWIRSGWTMGNGLRFITKENNFTQYFHPAVKDNYTIFVDMARGYNRYISEVNILSGEKKIILKGKHDIRNPNWTKGILYFTSDETGIFNIYMKDKTKIYPLTNSISGAFMPSVYENSLLYSEYKNLGFKISKMDSIRPVSRSEMKYNVDKNPFKLKNNRVKRHVKNDVKTLRQRYKFDSYFIIPRLMFDDKCLKLGIAFQANELLNKSYFYFTALYNSIGDRDIYAEIEVRNISLFGRDPILFLNFYNQRVSKDERLKVRFDAQNQFIEANRRVKFIIWQYEIGFKLKLWDALDWKMTYISSKYDANLSPTISDEIYDNGTKKRILYPFLRYSYHKGNALQAKFLYETQDHSLTGEIAPKNTKRFLLALDYNNYGFLDHFSFNTAGLFERYKYYNYLSLSLSTQVTFPNLWKNSSWMFEFNISKNFAEVDEFYDHYVGGWPGLKGYPFYARHGKIKFISSLYFTQVFATELMLNIGFMRLKNLAFSSYFQIGDAWKTNTFNPKMDAGFQFKADSYGALKIFFDLSIPFQKVESKQRNSLGDFERIIYPKKFRYYFGLLYNFELKEIF